MIHMIHQFIQSYMLLCWAEDNKHSRCRKRMSPFFCFEYVRSVIRASKKQTAAAADDDALVVTSECSSVQYVYLIIIHLSYDVMPGIYHYLPRHPVRKYKAHKITNSVT